MTRPLVKFKGKAYLFFVPTKKYVSLALFVIRRKTAKWFVSLLLFFFVLKKEKRWGTGTANCSNSKNAKLVQKKQAKDTSYLFF